MQTQQGFIQAPILIAIIVGVVIVGGMGYVGMYQYKNYQEARVEKEKQAQAFADSQQKALEGAKSEIEKLKVETTKTKQGQAVLEQKLSQSGKTQSKTEISSLELQPYLSSVVWINCITVSGSGTIWKVNGVPYVLTNFHVIEGPRAKNYSNCVFLTEQDATKDAQFYTGSIDLGSVFVWNDITDIATLKISKLESKGNESANSDVLNYSIFGLPNCSNKMPVGTRIFVIGYPAFGVGDVGGWGQMRAQIASDGVISGYDNSDLQLPYPNYFVSAKIDSGNSGGIALSKNQQGLCTLGVPTWVSVGNYETNGVVQNIHNIIYQN